MIKPADAPFDDDDFGAEFDPSEFEVLPGGREELPADLAPLCEEFFAPGGPLKQAALQGGGSYEFRPQQIDMSAAIAIALSRGENLCVEAPTGVGKSFAYLVPLIYRSQQCGRPAVVSTETINLQEQLIEKDIPLLRELTGVTFKAALAKGRGNYLCRRRLDLLSGEQRDALLPSPTLVLDVEHFQSWIKGGADGDRDSIDFHFEPSAWSQVCCDGMSCLSQRCPHYRNCYYFKARLEWETADIIVANHALFFTDLAMRMGSDAAGALLPNYGAVLIDEAHTLENNAAEYLGLHLSRAGIVSTLHRLYHPEQTRGLLMRGKGERTPGLRGLIASTRDEAYAFFTPYENLLAERNESALKISEPERFPDRLSARLLDLIRDLGNLAEDEEDAAFRVEIEAQLARCREYVNGIDEFTRQTLPDAVYYVEEDRHSVALNAAPLNVAEILGEILFNGDFPVILCSATLTVRNRFDYYTGRTGFCNGGTLQLDSPFDPSQARVYIPRDMPDPKEDSEYHDALIREIPRFIDLTHGKAFTLFTSYRSLRCCADALRNDFARKGINLLVQGENQTRSNLLREFKEDINSVLFGTDSFWTGVDVPGEALSNVIVTKLPFLSPGHPLIKARMDRIEATGKSSFSEYSLPEAGLKLRQGVGRLIRNRRDRGIIVLLDRRVISKNYGKTFLDSLPYPYEIV